MPKTMSLRLDDEQALALEHAARVNGDSVNETVRQAIDARLAELRRDEDFQARLRRHLDENKRALDLLSK